MDRIKSFSGSVATSTVETINKSYGMSGTEKISRERTDVLNNALVEFLDECGVDVEYDGNYLWINGVPVVFYGNLNYYYYGCFFPFNINAVVAGSTTTTDIFANAGNGGFTYNFKLRLLGEPTGAFLLVISRNCTAPTFNQVFVFFKATNFINGRSSRLYRYGPNVSPMYAIDLDDNGLPVDIGRSTMANSVTYNLDTISVDYSNNPDKYPLVEWKPGIFKAEGCYYGLNNSPLPKATTAISDAQTFIKLGNDIYYVCDKGPLIKCIS